MERIDPNHLQNVTRETSEKTQPTSVAYRIAIARLIVKIRLAFSLPAFETQELAAAVETWCELLADVVPSERLNDAYLYAVRTRTSTFALAVTEVLTAWRAIAAEEAEQAKRRRHCHVCQGRRFEMVYNPSTDTEVEKECPYCFGDISTAIGRVN